MEPARVVVVQAGRPVGEEELDGRDAFQASRLGGQQAGDLLELVPDWGEQVSAHGHPGSHDETPSVSLRSQQRLDAGDQLPAMPCTAKTNAPVLDGRDRQIGASLADQLQHMHASALEEHGHAQQQQQGRRGGGDDQRGGCRRAGDQGGGAACSTAATAAIWCAADATRSRSRTSGWSAPSNAAGSGRGPAGRCEMREERFTVGPPHAEPDFPGSPRATVYPRAGRCERQDAGGDLVLFEGAHGPLVAVLGRE